MNSLNWGHLRWQGWEQLGARQSVRWNPPDFSLLASPPLFILWTFQDIFIFFIFQPEAEPVDIPLLRFQPFERTLMNVSSFREVDEIDRLSLETPRRIEFPLLQNGRGTDRLDSYRRLYPVKVEPWSDIEPNGDRTWHWRSLRVHLAGAKPDCKSFDTALLTEGKTDPTQVSTGTAP